MRKIEEVLRLKWGHQLCNRQIANSCLISHTTVREYLDRARLAGLSWPLDPALDNTTLVRSQVGSDQATLLIFKGCLPKSVCFQALDPHFHGPKCPSKASLHIQLNRLPALRNHILRVKIAF